MNLEDYIILKDTDIIPDTNLIAYINYETDETKVFENRPDTDWELLGLLVTKDYYRLAELSKSKYYEVKECCDSIRNDDEQYEDSSEWNARESYNEFYQDGRWSDIFWDII